MTPCLFLRRSILAFVCLASLAQCTAGPQHPTRPAPERASDAAFARFAPAAPEPGAEAVAAPVEAPAPHSSQSKCYAGNPLPTSAYRLLTNTGYDVGYSEEHKDPLWAAYHLVASQMTKTAGPRPKRFSVDNRTEAKIKHEDYAQAEPRLYDRGHMAPNHAIAVAFGQAAQKETFRMSNVCPQRSTLNQQTWEALEHRIADEYSESFEELWVIVGPIFRGSVQRLNQKAEIPDAFFMIVVDEDDGQLRALAVIMDQTVTGQHPLSDFVVSIDDIEAATGLDFMAGLTDPVEDALEASTADSDWRLDSVLR